MAKQVTRDYDEEEQGYDSEKEKKEEKKPAPPPPLNPQAPSVNQKAKQTLGRADPEHHSHRLPWREPPRTPANSLKLPALKLPLKTVYKYRAIDIS